MWNKVRSRPRYDSHYYGLKSGKVMNQATLVRDLKQLEDRALNLLSINFEFVPTMLVIINTLAWGLFGKAVKVE